MNVYNGMNVYIWKYAEQITDSWHDGGGVLAIAESEEEARTLIKAGSPVAVLGDVDLVLALAGPTEKRVIIFPDAGCC